MWKASRQHVPEREEPSSCQKAQHRNREQGDSQFLFASTLFRTMRLCAHSMEVNWRHQKSTQLVSVSLLDGNLTVRPECYPSRINNT